MNERVRELPEKWRKEADFYIPGDCADELEAALAADEPASEKLREAIAAIAWHRGYDEGNLDGSPYPSQDEISEIIKQAVSESEKVE